jgi:hypothetical protein
LGQRHRLRRAILRRVGNEPVRHAVPNVEEA